MLSGQSEEKETPRRLPAGAHGLPREVVQRNQRERLIAAMAEVCAERGYADTSVADVARRASVSTASFYRQFTDRRACMLASFAELFDRLLEEVERACQGEGKPARAATAIHTMAKLLTADSPSARLLTVEILAVGVEGVHLQHEAIERLAEVMQVDWVTAAGVVSLAARKIVRGEELVAADLNQKNTYLNVVKGVGRSV